MEIAYLHLITNHIPIIGVPFAVLVLLWGIWRNSDEVKTASFVLFALVGIGTIAVYLLGQGGEDFIEDLPGVSHDAIEAHEEFALFALVSVLVLAGVSAFALLRYRLFRTAPAESSTVFPRWAGLVVLALGLTSTAVLGYTGRLGGKIRHPEFHGSQVNESGEAENTDEADDESGKRRGRNRGGR